MLHRSTSGRRRRRARLRPRIDLLECRRVLSAAGVLQVSSDVPAIVEPTLDHITMTFSPALSRAYLDPSMVDVVGLVDGEIGDSVFMTTTPESIDVDPDGSFITITLGGPLDPGQYGLVFYGQPGLLFADGGEVIDPTETTIVSTFDVQDSSPQPPQGPTLADALPIVLTDSQVASLDGALDLGDARGAVGLYQIQIPEGQTLQFGADVETLGGGAADPQAVATLLDDQGVPIGTARVATHEGTPHHGLFRGLRPGTYYIAVSWDSNPAASADQTGFDIATGDPGLLVPGMPAISYRLSVITTPLSPTARVIDVRTDRADLLSDVTSGFTLQFSSVVLAEQGIDLATAELKDGVEIVGPDGRTYETKLVGFDADHATLSFLLPEALAPGRYIIRASGIGQLIDLAGRTPEGDGLEPGEFAVLNIEEATTPPADDPADFGVIFPAGPTTRTLPVDPASGDLAIRFVVPAQGFYQITTRADQDDVTLELDGPDGKQLLNSGPASQWLTNLLSNIPPGVYTLRVRSASPASLDVTIRAASIDAESILKNGVGAGSTLDLRLIAPTIPPPPSTPPPSALPPTNHSGTTPGGADSALPGTGSTTIPTLPIDTPSSTGSATTVTLSSDAGGPVGPFAASAQAGSATAPGATGRSTAAGPMSLAAGLGPGVSLPLGDTLIGRPDAYSGQVAALAAAGRSSAPSPGLPANQQLAARSELARYAGDRRLVVAAESEPGEDPAAAGEELAGGPPRIPLDVRIAESMLESLEYNDNSPFTDEQIRELLALNPTPPAATEAPGSTEQAASLMEPAGLTLLFALIAQQGRRLVRRPDRKNRPASRSSASGIPRPAFFTRREHRRV